MRNKYSVDVVVDELYVRVLDALMYHHQCIKCIKKFNCFIIIAECKSISLGYRRPAMKSQVCRLDRNKCSGLLSAATGNIQLINNSNKGSGNTLRSGSQSYRGKSKVHSI